MSSLYDKLPYDVLDYIVRNIYKEFAKRVQINYDRYFAEKINNELLCTQYIANNIINFFDNSYNFNYININNNIINNNIINNIINYNIINNNIINNNLNSYINSIDESDTDDERPELIHI